MFEMDLILERFSLLDEIEMVDLFIEEHNDLFLEMKSKKEYRERAFKKKYDYDPKTKTIEVNGKRVNVTFNAKNNKRDYLTGEKSPAGSYMTINTHGRPTMNISPDSLYKSKNNKRVDAIVQHEMGHGRLHQRKLDSSTLDRSMLPKQNRIVGYRTDKNDNTVRIADRSAEEYREQYKDICLKEYKEYVKKKTGKNPPITHLPRELEKFAEMYEKRYGSASSNAEKIELREQFRNKVFKYVDKHVDHANIHEFEADRYAANKVGASEMNKALRGEYKQARKNTKEEYDKYIRLLKTFRGKYGNKELTLRDLNQMRKDIEKEFEKERKSKEISRFKIYSILKDRLDVFVDNRHLIQVAELEKKLKKAEASINKDSQKDMDQRAKALRDKSVTNKEKEIYN